MKIESNTISQNKGSQNPNKIVTNFKPTTCKYLERLIVAHASPIMN